MVLSPLPDPPLGIRKPWIIFKGFVFSTTLFSALVLINFAQMASVVVLPFSRSLFRRFNRFCANFWWASCVFVGVKINGVKLTITGDPVPDEENAVVVANHQ